MSFKNAFDKIKGTLLPTVNVYGAFEESTKIMKADTFTGGRTSYPVEGDTVKVGRTTYKLINESEPVTPERKEFYLKHEPKSIVLTGSLKDKEIVFRHNNSATVYDNAKSLDDARKEREASIVGAESKMQAAIRQAQQSSMKKVSNKPQHNVDGHYSDPTALGRSLDLDP